MESYNHPVGGVLYCALARKGCLNAHRGLMAYDFTDFAIASIPSRWDAGWEPSLGQSRKMCESNSFFFFFVDLPDEYTSVRGK